MVFIFYSLPSMHLFSFADQSSKSLLSNVKVMGSEQSHPAAAGHGAPSSFTTGDLSAFSASLRDGAMSPRQDSVCSDSEVPYVSYTVNKPIGDSPQKSSSRNRYKFSNLSQRSASTASSLNKKSFGSQRGASSKNNTLVVVNKDTVKPSHDDTELQRLAKIPTFLPVMRASLSVNKSSAVVAKDPDILEKLDPRGLMAITQRYQTHLKHCAGVVSTEQAELCKKIRDIDDDVIKVTNHLSDKQKVFSHQAEDMKKSVKEMSKALTKCHLLLNENLEQLEIINNMLPKDDRLEPFVWTTG